MWNEMALGGLIAVMLLLSWRQVIFTHRVSDIDRKVAYLTARLRRVEEASDDGD